MNKKYAICSANMEDSRKQLVICQFASQWSPIQVLLGPLEGFTQLSTSGTYGIRQGAHELVGYPGLLKQE